MEKLNLSDLISAEFYTNRMAHETEEMMNKAKPADKNTLRKVFEKFKMQNMRFQMEIYNRLDKACQITN